MADNDLKIFISWSGELAKAVTREIRTWLPKLFDRIDPWMSDIDIQAGTRGLQLIEDRLNNSSFGIIVVTTENQHKTWLNFEAGALSKRFEGGSGRVVPILVNFDDFYQIEGPIRQFQGVMLDKDGMRELLQSITNIAGSDWPMIEARFEWSWKDFEKAIEVARAEAGPQPKAPDVTESDLLQEILARLNSIEKRGLERPSSARESRERYGNTDTIIDILSTVGIGDVSSFELGTSSTGMTVEVSCNTMPEPKQAAAARKLASREGYSMTFLHEPTGHGSSPS
ncbi:TIR domain-containing protein [Rhodococcus sp. KBS0724]|uniref:toll/interleukin-1 receptor domain-containing protein n=1 Tax=Rhodococcus sp. KBS0724 TaxID=1179674 RepID=UPI00110EC7B0|nr:toll/interleukin-1 receptor domain-containing protein [Rhodococcus sp. KBS0724]TSD48572.1 TIR domain-containing protein [Rhodococcus sp. KBS0724]